MPAGKPKDKNMVKARLMVLTRMFYEKTDQEHPMTGAQILEFLDEHDVPANEKTLRGDIRLLQELGLDIVKVVSRPNLYFWGEREFEMAELKLLIDAVSSSRFIMEKKSRELGKKLSGLASEYQKKQLRRNINATKRIKPKKESLVAGAGDSEMEIWVCQVKCVSLFNFFPVAAEATGYLREDK